MKKNKTIESARLLDVWKIKDNVYKKTKKMNAEEFSVLLTLPLTLNRQRNRLLTKLEYPLIKATRQSLELCLPGKKQLITAKNEQENITPEQTKILKKIVEEEFK